MCATADRRVRPCLRQSAWVCLFLMALGFADLPLCRAGEAGDLFGAAGRASCDARHSDPGSPHSDHSDDSDIPAVDAAAGFGPLRRLPSPRPESAISAARKPQVRPPSI
jgi:hypothetical protein